MKIFLILFTILLLLVSCKEPEEKKETNYKSQYDIVNTVKLRKLDEEFKNLGFLSLSYASIVSQQDLCDIFEDTIYQSNNEELRNLMSKKLIECNYYRKLYKIVIPNFENINTSNYINHYYFEFRDDFSDTVLANKIGIFLNLENCNKFKNEFLIQELGFTSNCKKILNSN